MSLNKVMLIGNVGKDPEVRYLENNPAPQGTNPKVAQFTLATTERFRDRNGEVRENTEWHNIVAWRGLADLAEKYIRKGSQLYIEGRIRTRSWNDQAGAKQYRTEIVATPFSCSVASLTILLHSSRPTIIRPVIRLREVTSHRAEPTCLPDLLLARLLSRLLHRLSLTIQVRLTTFLSKK